MRYLTAVEAAKRIGVTERTIRLWIEQGKLSAHREANNRLAIPESEVTDIAIERGVQFAMDKAVQSDTPEMAMLALKVIELEAKVIQLESELKKTKKEDNDDEEKSPAKRSYTRKQKDLPPGCILVTDFARHYGVNPITFRDHILIGLGKGEKEKVKAEERPKPGREKEIERYLTPDQQIAALDFWERHNVPYQKSTKKIIEENNQEDHAA
jgi:excisionase family DNA binding protein